MTYTPRSARPALAAYYAALIQSPSMESFRVAEAAVSDVMASTCSECPHEGYALVPEVLTDDEKRQLLVSSPAYRSLMLRAAATKAMAAGVSGYSETLRRLADLSILQVRLAHLRGEVDPVEEQETWVAIAETFGEEAFGEKTLAGEAALNWLQMLYNVGALEGDSETAESALADYYSALESGDFYIVRHAITRVRAAIVPEGQHGAADVRAGLLTQDEVERFLATEDAFVNLLLDRAGAHCQNGRQQAWQTLEIAAWTQPEIAEVGRCWVHTAAHLARTPFKTS